MHGVATDAQFRELVGRCEPCDSAMQHNPPKHGKPASWQCARCYRSGVYAKERCGNHVVIARVELRAGDPALRKPWVPAESLPYVERIAA